MMSLLGPNLEAFLAIVRAGTVHGAASELDLTQTGVTQRIRALESQLATTLFVRSRRGMALTSEGTALLRYCQAARELEGEVFARLAGSGTRATERLSLAGPTSLMRSRVIPQATPVLRAFPMLAATFEITDSEHRDRMLRTGQCQLAILSPERVAREMDSKLLRPEQYVLVGTPAWRKRPLPDLLRDERIIDFDADDPMTHSYLKHFDLLEHAQSERHFVNNTESLVELFSQGIGYGVLTVEFARPHVERGAIALLNRGRFLENPVALAWYPRPNMPKYFAAIIKAIK
jgi:LysR family transcriptional regulator, chromosome initiation inhibitor